MTPQAMLQPRALTSISRTSARPAVATLREPVKVRTMISPKRTSDTRSIGSSTLFGEWRSVAVGKVHHPVGEVLGPAEGLLHGPARVQPGADDAEREVVVDAPVHVPVRLEADVVGGDLGALRLRPVEEELVEDEAGPYRLAGLQVQPHLVGEE